jgi:hypothetical protein
VAKQNTMTGKIQYEFTSILWQQASTMGWHFVSLPEKTSTEIRVLLRSHEEGWGRLKATAKIGTTEWKTAIWFDTKRNTYLLPIKATIRNKEKLILDDEIAVIIWV